MKFDKLKVICMWYQANKIKIKFKNKLCYTSCGETVYKKLAILFLSDNYTIRAINKLSIYGDETF